MVARRPDLILVQSVLRFELLDALLFRLLRFASIRCAVTVHDTLPHYPRPWSRAARRIYYNSFDSLIAHSHRSLADLRRLGVHTQSAVVPHGVYDIFVLRKSSRAEAIRSFAQLRDDDFVVLFFGRIDERKGIATFLSAADALAHLPGYSFIVAGSNGIASQNSALRKRLASYKSRPGFVVHDTRIPFSEVERYFAAADLVVLPYHEGTTSGVLKLAMAFHKPVVATSVGDIPEALASGAGELLRQGATAPELVSAIKLIRSRPETYVAAAKRAGEGCDWLTVARSYFAFLFQGPPA